MIQARQSGKTPHPKPDSRWTVSGRALADHSYRIDPAIAGAVVLPNVNNWAHAAGFVSGFILGFLFWSETPRSETKTFRVAASSCMLLTIGALIYGLLFS